MDNKILDVEDHFLWAYERVCAVNFTQSDKRIGNILEKMTQMKNYHLRHVQTSIEDDIDYCIHCICVFMSVVEQKETYMNDVGVNHDVLWFPHGAYKVGCMWSEIYHSVVDLGYRLVRQSILEANATTPADELFQRARSVIGLFRFLQDKATAIWTDTSELDHVPRPGYSLDEMKTLYTIVRAFGLYIYGRLTNSRRFESDKRLKQKQNETSLFYTASRLLAVLPSSTLTMYRDGSPADEPIPNPSTIALDLKNISMDAILVKLQRHIDDKSKDKQPVYKVPYEMVGECNIPVVPVHWIAACHIRYLISYSEALWTINRHEDAVALAIVILNNEFYHPYILDWLATLKALRGSTLSTLVLPTNVDTLLKDPDYCSLSKSTLRNGDDPLKKMSEISVVFEKGEYSVEIDEKEKRIEITMNHVNDSTQQPEEEPEPLISIIQKQQQEEEEEEEEDEEEDVQS